ncbi:MAG: Mitochondrial inner membrane protein oxa1 [Candelina submexicana]|nr:MAG: Mitochondrial inner membrane protein oxa1 [Candelina submexicana]
MTPKFTNANIRSQSSTTRITLRIPFKGSYPPWQRPIYSPTKFAITIVSRRLNSTAPNVPPAPDSATSSVSSDPLLSKSVEDVVDIAASDGVKVTEHIGYLKELGLDYGWGPTACVEWLLEHIHIYTGTPWWASIMLTAVVIRLALLKPYLESADTSARMANVKHIMKPFTDRMTEATKTKDTLAVQQCRLELQRIYRRAGIKTWKLAIPLVQVFLGFGTFRLMRGMTSLPVPGLETGGFLWLHDLTIPDPYFMMPVATAFAFYTVMKLGGETGASLVNPKIRFTLTYILPTMTGAIMLSWPGALQMSFLFSSWMSVMQASLLRSNSFRDWAGIMRMPVAPKVNPNGTTPSPYSGKMTLAQKPAAAASTPASPVNKAKGILDGAISDVKGATSEAVKMAKQLSGTETKRGTKTASELREAQAYEARRKKELEQQSKLARWQKRIVSNSRKGGR